MFCTVSKDSKEAGWGSSGTMGGHSSFSFNISLWFILYLYSLFAPVSQSASQQVRKIGRGRLGGRNWCHQPTTVSPSCNSELSRFLQPSLSWVNRLKWEWTQGWTCSIVYFHRGCDGEFHVPAWLGCSSQLLNPTLILVLLGQYFINVIKVYNPFTLRKEDYPR